MRISIIILSSILISLLSTGLPKEKVSKNSFGTIVRKDSTTYVCFASAFLCFKPNWVVTCLHVIEGKDTVYFHPGNSGENFPLVEIASFPELDIAILELPKGIIIPPLKIYDRNISKIGDSINYIGYDQPSSEKDGQVHMSVNQSIISSLDEQYINFIGYCHTGYSGSPILDTNKKVIGLITSSGVISEKQDIMFVKGTLLNSQIINSNLNKK